MRSTKFNRSLGKRKESRTGKNCKRSGKSHGDLIGEQFVRTQHLSRWPDEYQEDMYFKMNNNKKKESNPAQGRIKPPVREFALMESLSLKVIDKLLTAACFQIKRVKRFPGWILIRTYNMKKRVIQFI